MDRLPDHWGEELPDLRREGPLIDLRHQEPGEVVAGVVEQGRQRPLDAGHVLELFRRRQHRLEIEGVLGELLQLGEGVRVDVEQVEDEERPLVHLVRLVQVGEELHVLPLVRTPMRALDAWK